GTAVARRLPPQSVITNPTIGDRLTAAGIDWAWYSGGWSNANGNVGGPGWTNGSNGTSCTDPNGNLTAGYPLCPAKNLHYHHQSFNYYSNFVPRSAHPAAHLR